MLIRYLLSHSNLCWSKNNPLKPSIEAKIWYHTLKMAIYVDKPQPKQLAHSVLSTIGRKTKSVYIDVIHSPNGHLHLCVWHPHVQYTEQACLFDQASEIGVQIAPHERWDSPSRDCFIMSIIESLPNGLVRASAQVSLVGMDWTEGKQANNDEQLEKTWKLMSLSPAWR